MRTTQFALGETYHIFNRGVDKRSIFSGVKDFRRFVVTMRIMNQLDINVRLANLLRGDGVVDDDVRADSPPLVRIHTYCINQNHFHFLLEPLVDDGIQKFMHRLGTAYTKYFNKRHARTGSLFQGTYKSIHVATNEYFMHLGCYITLNHLVHPKLNKPWLLAQAFSALGEYGGREVSNSLAYTNLLSSQYKSSAHFLREAHATVARVAKLRDEIRLYKQLCID